MLNADADGRLRIDRLVHTAPSHEPESLPVLAKSGFWRLASVISRAARARSFARRSNILRNARRVLASSEAAKPAVISLSYARAIGPRMLTNSTPRGAIETTTSLLLCRDLCRATS